MAPMPTVLLRLDGQPRPLTITLRDDFASEAMKWSYVARNRDRWTSGTDPGQGDNGPLQAYLMPEDLQRIAEARLIEVGIPSSKDESADWPLRLFPWEYALSAATRALRSEPLLIVRHLRTGRTGFDGRIGLQRAGMLEGAPGRLAQWYDTQAESDLMLSSLGRDPAAERLRLSKPSRGELQEWLRREEPTLLHIAGVDSHQAAALLGLHASQPLRKLRDGLALRPTTNSSDVDFVDSEDIATMIGDLTRPPDLVVFNIFNSASRLAARSVAHGARCAIGYHDVIDDELAGLFCSVMYGRLADTEGNMLEAFEAGLRALRGQAGEALGDSVVLWSQASLVGAPQRESTRAPRARTSSHKSMARAIDVPPAQRIAVLAEARGLFNYSLMHNKQSLFRRLLIFRRNVNGPIRNIHVEVALNDGEGVFPFRRTLELKEGQSRLDLAGDVVLPLTSSLLRTQSERIQSSLSLLVRCEGEVVMQDTYRIGLAPVDEWQDGQGREWRWLPSFILPRDRAVARIIDSAQGVLRALADDPTAGFDGYQSLDRDAPTDAARYGSVDKQVQAIWYALLDSHGLSYINPPPSYAYNTQRLRTPSQLLAERRGTCIDLALLLAACLEYVDIYPVIFLLTGHAFAGYWRSGELHADFLAMKGLELVFDSNESVSSTAAGAGSTNNPGYVLDRQQGREVRDRVFHRALVPLEATWLTARGGFESAAAEGQSNMRRGSDFQAMIDVRLARDRGVTPLPLLGSSR